jgi:hypothetical protein
MSTLEADPTECRVPGLDADPEAELRAELPKNFANRAPLSAQVLVLPKGLFSVNRLALTHATGLYAQWHTQSKRHRTGRCSRTPDTHQLQLSA